MAATTEVMNTTIMTLSVDTAVVGDCVDASLSFTHSTRNITNKQDSGWRRLAEGLREWSMSSSFMYVPDHADHNFGDNFALLTGRGVATARIASTTATDHYYEGSGYIGTGSLNSNGVEDNVTSDFTIEGSDALASGAVT